MSSSKPPLNFESGTIADPDVQSDLWVPIELIQEIIHILWYSTALSSKERINLLCTLRLVNHAWWETIMRYAQRDVHIPSYMFGVQYYFRMMGLQNRDTKCHCMTFRVEEHVPKGVALAPRSSEWNGKSINDILTHVHLPNLRRVVIEYVHTDIQDLAKQSRLRNLPTQVTELEIYHTPRMIQAEEVGSSVWMFPMWGNFQTPPEVTKLTLVGLSICYLFEGLKPFTKLEELVFGPEHRLAHRLDTSGWTHSDFPELKGACVARVVLHSVFMRIEKREPDRIGRFKKVTYRGKHFDVPESEQSKIEELCARYRVSISFILEP